MAKHNELGKKGEQLAVSFLENKGYRILHTNWTFDKAELDIIAENSEFVVFVEVKTRSTDVFGSPAESVTLAKQKHLLKTIEAWFDESGCTKEARIDIISIVIDKGKQTIEHLEGGIIPFN